MPNPFMGLDWNAPTNSDTQKREYVPVPEGEHIAIVKEASINTNDKGSSLAVKLYFPKFNTTETDFTNISQNALGILKSKLNLIGLRGVAPGLIEENLHLAKDVKLLVTKKLNGKYRNYYFKSAPSTNDDKVPF